MDKERIAVGDSARLEIVFDTKTSRTRVTKRPKIYVKDSDLPRSVEIIANVMAQPDSGFPVRFDPYKLDVSQFGEKERSEIDFQIVNVSDQDLNVEMLSYDKRFFSVELPKVVKANSSASGKLTIAKDKLPESFEKSFTVGFQGPNDKVPQRYTLPVKRAVRVMTDNKIPPTTTSKGGTVGGSGH